MNDSPSPLNILDTDTHPNKLIRFSSTFKLRYERNLTYMYNVYVSYNFLTLDINFVTLSNTIVYSKVVEFIFLLWIGYQ